jgi:hypothetical protein
VYISVRHLDYKVSGMETNSNSVYGKLKSNFRLIFSKFRELHQSTSNLELFWTSGSKRVYVHVHVCKVPKSGKIHVVE